MSINGKFPKIKARIIRASGSTVPSILPRSDWTPARVSIWNRSIPVSDTVTLAGELSATNDLMSSMNVVVIGAS